MPFDQGMLLSVAQVDLPDATTKFVLQGVPCSKRWLDHSLDPGLRWRDGGVTVGSAGSLGLQIARSLGW